MNNPEIIRAWKDENYFESLSTADQSVLPENPAGFIDLSDVEMEAVAGGGTNCIASTGCCPFITTTCPSFTGPECNQTWTCGCSAISELVMEEAELEPLEL